MSDLLFELLQVAVGNRVALSHRPSQKEWMEIYGMARKQAILGVCFFALQKLKKEQVALLPIDVKMQWLGIATQIKQRNKILNKRCIELHDMLADAGFRSCILKGQAVARLYSTDEGPVIFNDSLKLYRQSGDIDVWVEGSRESVMEYVNSVSPTNDVRWLHSHLSIYKDTDVEVHFMPSYIECPWQDKALQRFFDSEREKCFDEGMATDKFNQVFILAHAFRHLFSEGVGLRQLMDYYFVLRNSEERLTQEEFVDVMKLTGMMRFAEALMWIMREVFGLQEQYLLCTPSEKDGHFLLKEVMLSGNFGHEDVRVRHVVGENTVRRFCRIAIYNMRVWRFSPMIVICSPIWRVWHWCWRKEKGYK